MDLGFVVWECGWGSEGDGEWVRWNNVEGRKLRIINVKDCVEQVSQLFPARSCDSGVDFAVKTLNSGLHEAEPWRPQPPFYRPASTSTLPPSLQAMLPCSDGPMAILLHIISSPKLQHYARDGCFYDIVGKEAEGIN